jgi:hypothetical protein
MLSASSGILTMAKQQVLAWLLCDHCGPRLKYLATVRYRTLGWEFDELVGELYLHLSKREWQALRLFAGQNGDGRACSLVSYITLIASRLMGRKLQGRASESAARVAHDNGEIQNVPDPSPSTRERPPSWHRRSWNWKTRRTRHPDPSTSYRGVDVNEIAALLGISTANAYTRCHRAIARLRNLLKEDGVNA